MKAISILITLYMMHLSKSILTSIPSVSKVLVSGNNKHLKQGRIKLGQHWHYISFQTLSTSMFHRSSLWSHANYTVGMNTAPQVTSSESLERKLVDEVSIESEPDVSLEESQPISNQESISKSTSETSESEDNLLEPKQPPPVEQSASTNDRTEPIDGNKHDKPPLLSGSLAVKEHDIISKYKPRIVQCKVDRYPNIDIFLCGTVHVSKSSVNMVADVIQTLRPELILVELCAERAESLYDSLQTDSKPLTLRDIVREAFYQRSLGPIWTGIISWMQTIAAKQMGSEVGGEFVVAVKEGAKIGSNIILGDRDSHVTIARIFDNLNFIQMVKFFVFTIMDVVTLPFIGIKKYIEETESDEDFLMKEMKKFSKLMPKLSEVLIHERDEYLAQSILETLRLASMSSRRRGRMVAVLGHGHLQGVQRWLQNGGSSPGRLAAISSSSKHPAPTWPEDGGVRVFSNEIFKNQSN